MSLSKNTKSFNASGVFLQTYVVNELQKRKWETDIEYPVVVAPFRKNPRTFTHYWNGNPNKPTPENFVSAIRDSQNSFERSERSIDVVSSRDIDDNRRITLCIECKKLHPRYLQWCFFDEKRRYSRNHLVTKSINPQGEAILFQTVGTTQYSNEIYLSLEDRYAKAWDFWPKTIADYALALTDKELKGDYFQTEQTVIDKACIQIIEGTYGFTLDSLISQILAADPNEYGIKEIFIPIIVTNADLQFCKFNRDSIDPHSGHITEEPEYEKIDSIFYEYNSPKTVQYPEPLFDSSPSDLRKNTSKWDVLIVSPTGLETLLNDIDRIWDPVDIFS